MVAFNESYPHFQGVWYNGFPRFFISLPLSMTKWTAHDITAFQKLYAEEYGETLTTEQASVRITALVELISLAIEVENSSETVSANRQSLDLG